MDILNKGGYAAVYFFGVSIIKINIKFVGIDFNDKRLSLSFNDRVMSFSFLPGKDGKMDKDSIFNYLTIPILTIIDFVYFDLRFDFGYKKDALLTAFAVQSARMAFQAFTSVLKSQQELLVDDEYIPHYGKDILKIHFSGIISGSATNIIYSIVHALRLKKEKRERKSRKRLKGVNA